jgi:hypothetical protein
MGGPGVSGQARRPYLPSMGQTGRDRRPADPFSILTHGMRQIGSLDLDKIKQGMAYLTNPDASFLDMLGRTREERVEKIATLLANMSPAEMEEMGTIYALAIARAAEAGSQDRAEVGRRTDRPRQRRGQSSAEWRRERRLAS